MSNEELKDKIQERLNVHNCTGRCTDYILEIFEKAVEETKREVLEKILKGGHGGGNWRRLIMMALTEPE